MYFLSHSQEQAQCIHEREPGDVVTSPTAQARAGCSPQTGALPQPRPFPLGPLCWEVSLPSPLGGGSSITFCWEGLTVWQCFSQPTELEMSP